MKSSEQDLNLREGCPLATHTHGSYSSLYEYRGTHSRACRLLQDLRLRSPWFGRPLNGTKVTGAGLVHLKKLQELRSLGLTDTLITDAGLVHLKELQGLQVLELSGTKVSDAGLIHLRELQGLQELAISGTKVTDAGLVHLKEIKGLKWLWLLKTSVTDAGVEGLRTALPECQIFEPDPATSQRH